MNAPRQQLSPNLPPIKVLVLNLWLQIKVWRKSGGNIQMFSQSTRLMEKSLSQFHWAPELAADSYKRERNLRAKLTSRHIEIGRALPPSPLTDTRSDQSHGAKGGRRTSTYLSPPLGIHAAGCAMMQLLMPSMQVLVLAFISQPWGKSACFVSLKWKLDRITVTLGYFCRYGNADSNTQMPLEFSHGQDNGNKY